MQPRKLQSNIAQKNIATTITCPTLIFLLYSTVAKFISTSLKTHLTVTGTFDIPTLNTIFETFILDTWNDISEYNCLLKPLLQ